MRELSRNSASGVALAPRGLWATVTTKQLAEGIAIDIDEEGHLAGIEILDARERFGGLETFRQVMMERVGIALPV